MTRLNRPTARVEDNQRSGDHHGTDVQLAPFTGDHAADNQRREADHDAGNDVTSQDDHHRGDKARHRINEVVEIDTRHVAQHQQADVHQRRSGGVARNQIRQRGEEQNQQEQHANGDGG